MLPFECNVVVIVSTKHNEFTNYVPFSKIRDENFVHVEAHSIISSVHASFIFIVTSKGF